MTQPPLRQCKDNAAKVLDLHATARTHPGSALQSRVLFCVRGPFATLCASYGAPSDRRHSRCERGSIMIVTTANDLPGYKVVKVIGVVRGITVRSRNLIANIGGGIQSLFGGKLSVYVKLAESARQEAYDQLVAHAGEEGANAIIAMRYDANEIMDGITEVLAYGTAVVVEPA